MVDIRKKNLFKRTARALRVRAKISGTAERPRASVKRSLKHISVQLIDDQNGKTLAAASDVKIKRSKGQTKTDVARAVGEAVAAAAQKAGITTVIFDRGSHAYHGRVKALADGMRAKGLMF
ncbi:MAG: 50S ribosomal protein L18 [Candidatus Kerfeldbacteria bacterium]|nr:50S ribosomal protein L18 [Candidatus Kerfeldbacteria bacterium]